MIYFIPRPLGANFKGGGKDEKFREEKFRKDGVWFRSTSYLGWLRG